MDLGKITATLVNTAIDIYLQLAYGDAETREQHSLYFQEDTPLEQVLTSFVSEDTSLKAWSLRLGSQDYPHMKIMLREAYLPGQFAFSVDRHDCFDFSDNSVGCEEWRELQLHNYQLKKSIEDAWYEAKVPTMRNLREKCLSSSDVFRVMSGKKVLLVDNDSDAVAIVDMILTHGGYECVSAESLAESKEVIAAEGKELIAVLVDLLLPDGMGYDLISAMRGNSATQNTPVIIISGMSEGDVDTAAADAFLRKPFSAEDILSTIGNVVKKYYEADGEFI